MAMRSENVTHFNWGFNIDGARGCAGPLRGVHKASLLLYSVTYAVLFMQSISLATKCPLVGLSCS